ncbi:Hypothetical predicted protein [Olea europaea subsp. europaea]|uniref:Uncharacterized protein n=1 Tax=Olea europaea subsp. europaea TaxID=158383 RepID=A0A8S0PR20_OLEEU|nr:Hypothetical predicted protein [Olea europaea subsp. europaea]
MNSSKTSADQESRFCNIDGTSQNTSKSFIAFIRQQQNQRQADRRNRIQTPRIDRHKRINDSTLSGKNNLGAFHAQKFTVPPIFQASTSNEESTNIVHSKCSME